MILYVADTMYSQHRYSRGASGGKAAREIMIMVSLEVALMKIPRRFSLWLGVYTPLPRPVATMVALSPTVAVTVFFSTAVFRVAPKPTLPPLMARPPATS